MSRTRTFLIIGVVVAAIVTIGAVAGKPPSGGDAPSDPVATEGAASAATPSLTVTAETPWVMTWPIEVRASGRLCSVARDGDLGRGQRPAT